MKRYIGKTIEEIEGLELGEGAYLTIKFTDGTSVDLSALITVAPYTDDEYATIEVEHREARERR